MPSTKSNLRFRADSEQAVMQYAGGNVDREIGRVDVAEVEADHQKRRAVGLLANADLKRRRRGTVGDLVSQILVAVVTGDLEDVLRNVVGLDRLIEQRRERPADLGLNAGRNRRAQRLERDRGRDCRRQPAARLAGRLEGGVRVGGDRVTLQLGIHRRAAS